MSDLKWSTIAIGERAAGQETPPQVASHNLDSSDPFDLPDPNRYRTGDSRPGPSYWQNEVDYQIDVSLDTARNRLSGTQTIAYTKSLVC
jgi:hypothetical protein